MQYVFFFFKQKTAYEIGLGIPAEPLFRSSRVSFPLSAADLPPSPTKSSNLSETAEVPACNVPSRSPLPALAIAPETKLGTASSGLGTLRSEERRVGKEGADRRVGQKNNKEQRE